VTAEGPAAAVEPRCPRCGTESKGAPWCPKCGLNLRAGNGRASAGAATVDATPQRSRRWMLALGVLAALALAACAVEGVVIVKKQHKIDGFGTRLAQATDDGYRSGKTAGFAAGSSNVATCYGNGYQSGYRNGWNRVIDEYNKNNRYIVGGNNDPWYDDAITGSCDLSGG
jgi:hypothetical protein